MTTNAPHSPMLHCTKMRRLSRAIGLAISLSTVFASAAAWAVAELPPEFEGVDVKDKLGAKIDLSLPLIDHTGREVALGKFFDGKRPVILTLNYYACESLCSAQLNALLTSVRQLEWVPGGDEFQMVTVSFDPRDTTEIAAGKRLSYARQYLRGKAEDAGEAIADEALDARADALGWEFLTASPAAIRALTQSLGYAYRFDEKSGQYAHSPVVYVLSPDGVISRYLFGISYPTQDLKFALMDASDGRIGSFGEKVLMSCFAFDPDGGGYGATAFGIMRLGAIMAVLLLGGFLVFHFRRERRNRRARAASHTTPSAV